MKPTAWDDTVKASNYIVDEQGVPKYLTSIVGSSLDWIADDVTREQIWEAASARLSERSGRSGSDISRQDHVLKAESLKQSLL